MSRRQASTAAVQPGVLQQTISLPAQPSAEPESDANKLSFWECVASVPEEDWWTGVHGEKGWKAYLYEDTPGSPYIAVIAHCFDIEWVKSEYGGGAYRAMLNDPSGKRIAFQKFSIDGDPRRKPPQGTAQPAPAQNAQDSAMVSLVEMIREEQKATREMLREVMQANRAAPANPTQDLFMTVFPTAMSGVIKVFTDILPRQENRNPIDDFIKMKELFGAQQRDPFAELVKLRELGLLSPAGSGGMGNIIEQLEMVTRVAERMGLSGGGGGKSIAEVIIDKGPDILTAIKGGIAEMRALEESKLKTVQAIAVANRTAQPQPAAAIPAAVTLPPAATSQHTMVAATQPMISQQTNAPQATPLAVEPIGAASPQSIAIPPDVTGEQMAQLTEEQLVLIRQKVVRAILQGSSGDDIVGFLAVEAPMVLNGFVGVPAPHVEAYFRNHPILAQAAGSPRFRQTIAEMVEILNDIPEGEAPDQKVN